MIKKFFRKLFTWRTRIDPRDLDRQTEEVERHLDDDRDRRNSIAGYLMQRRQQNGFGDDFEYTLRPRKAS